MEKIKRCTNCGRFLGISSFSIQADKRFPWGRRRSVCKKCHRTQNYIYKKTNRKYFEEWNANYHADHYQKNKEEILLKNRAWREANKDLVKEINRAWYEKNYEKNKDRYFHHAHLRRARLYEQTPKLSKSEVREIRILFRWAQEFPGEWHVDHIVPISKGGKHRLYNLQLIPASQNLSKHNRCPKEFYGRFYEFICLGKKKI
jgi:5-methylcytosine-specific restriction endonuclease McrA